MSTGPQLRDQLRSLSIPHEQRPLDRQAAGRRRSRSGLLTLLVLLSLGLAGYIGWMKFGSRITALTTTTAPATDVRLIKLVAQRSSDATAPALTATGKIVSDHRVQVSTKVSGQIVKLFFEQGDRVEEGQLLAQIEEENYRALRDEAAANLEKSRATLAFQKINFDRVSQLRTQQQASDIEYADARRSLDETQSLVAANEANLAYADKLLRDCKVLAPIAGVILERNVEVGDFVAAEGGRGAMANSQFTTIADMTKLRVEVDVSELDIARLRTGMPCMVVPDAYKDRRYHGHVMWIDPGANYAKATVQVKVRIDDPDDYLRVEGAAQVQFLTGGPATAATTSETPRLWIPATACIPDAAGGKAKVFVVADGRLKAVTANLGRREGDRIEVVSGLTEGQEIAADGLDQLRDGQLVRK
jgi:HlyD family secretion protein